MHTPTPRYWLDYGTARLALLSEYERDAFISWVSSNQELHNRKLYAPLAAADIVKLFRDQQIPPEYQVDEGL